VKKIEVNSLIKNSFRLEVQILI